MEGLWAYFEAEKRAGVVCFVLGAFAAGAAVGAWRGGGRWRGAGYTLGLVALVQLAVGLHLGIGTDGRVHDLIRQFDRQPAAALSGELARMNRVLVGFKVIELLEILFVAGGLVAAARARARDVVRAAALGLVVQASVMLTFDLVAETRARDYVVWLKRQT